MLLRCYTQNIDSLEALAGVGRERIVAAHGNFDAAHLAGRPAAAVDVEELRCAVLEGEGAIRALNERHGGLAKPAITFFGEPLPERFGELVPEDFAQCDLLIVMGTSLKVRPFALLPEFPNRGTPRLLINRQRVGPFTFQCDRGAHDPPAELARPTTDVFFEGDCDAGVRELARLAGMGDELTALIDKATGGATSPRIGATAQP